MTDDLRDATAFWYRTSAKNVLIFALIWLGEPLLILMFIKWMFQMSAFLYVFMAPWSFFGLIVGDSPALVRAYGASHEGQVQTGYGAIRQMDAAGFPMRLWPEGTRLAPVVNTALHVPHGEAHKSQGAIL